MFLLPLVQAGGAKGLPPGLALTLGCELLCEHCSPVPVPSTTRTWWRQDEGSGRRLAPLLYYLSVNDNTPCRALLQGHMQTRDLVLGPSQDPGTAGFLSPPPSPQSGKQERSDTLLHRKKTEPETHSKSEFISVLPRDRLRKTLGIERGRSLPQRPESRAHDVGMEKAGEERRKGTKRRDDGRATAIY